MASKRTLIVDDQMDIRRLLRESLRLLGLDMEIVDVPSGEEAMLVIARQRFDLLISDVRLAGMSGLELVRKVRKRNPGLKVILVTGLTDNEVRQQVSASGAEAFFFKPVDIASLQAAVKECLSEGEASKGPVSGVEAEGEPKDVILTPLAESFRAELGAECVLLADMEGKVHQRSGSLPDGFNEKTLVTSVLAVMRAAQNLAKTLHGEVPERTLISQGSGYHLHLIRSAGDRFFVALVRSPANGMEPALIEPVAVPVPELLAEQAPQA
jgi:CheY-like chemotaxis protein